MISKEDVKKLADLARIDISEKEATNLSVEMDAILDYIGQVSRVASQSGEARGGVDANQIKNAMREDEALHKPGEFSQELIKEFPNKKGDYLKVKKIL